MQSSKSFHTLCEYESKSPAIVLRMMRSRMTGDYAVYLTGH